MSKALVERSTQSLLSEFKMLDDNIDQMEKMISQQKSRRTQIYNHLYHERGMRSGHYKLNGIDSLVHVQNGKIEVTFPAFPDIDDAVPLPQPAGHGPA